MRSLLLSSWFLLISGVLVSSAEAGTITVWAVCGGLAYTGLTSASCSNSGPSGIVDEANALVSVGDTLIYVSAGSDANPGYPSYGSAEIDGNFAFEVTNGLGQGFFVPCVYFSADEAGNAGGSFGDSGLGSTGGNVGSARVCGAPSAFTAGVAQTLAVSLSASASTIGWYPGQATGGSAGADIELFDSSMNPVTGATYSLTEVGTFGPPPVPEPMSAWLLLLGLSVLAIMCRRARVISSSFRLLLR